MSQDSSLTLRPEFDVFISHSTEDKTVADAVCHTLEANGLRCWIAPRDILPGSTWSEAIIDGLDAAKTFVLVFSSHANHSQNVLREVERAISKSMVVIPFRVEDVKPVRGLEYCISLPHWLDALTPPLQNHIDRLAKTVVRILGSRVESKPGADRHPPENPIDSPPQTAAVVGEQPPAAPQLSAKSALEPSTAVRASTRPESPVPTCSTTNASLRNIVAAFFLTVGLIAGYACLFARLAGMDFWDFWIPQIVAGIAFALLVLSGFARRFVIAALFPGMAKFDESPAGRIAVDTLLAAAAVWSPFAFSYCNFPDRGCVAFPSTICGAVAASVIVKQSYYHLTVARKIRPAWLFLPIGCASAALHVILFIACTMVLTLLPVGVDFQRAWQVGHLTTIDVSGLLTWFYFCTIVMKFRIQIHQA